MIALFDRLMRAHLGDNALPVLLLGLREGNAVNARPEAIVVFPEGMIHVVDFEQVRLDWRWIGEPTSDWLPLDEAESIGKEAPEDPDGLV